VSLERLISCTCGHTFEDHGAEGCGSHASGRACTCRLPRNQIVDVLLERERVEVAGPWRGHETREPAGG